MADHAVVAEDEVDLSRRKFLTRATIATGAVGTVLAAVPFIQSWSPSERARAQGAPTELDLSKLEPGQMATPCGARPRSTSCDALPRWSRGSPVTVGC